MDAKDLQLSDGDFTLLIKALDCLPNADMAGDIAVMLLEGLLAPMDPNAKAQYEGLKRSEQDKKKRQMEVVKEECQILVGRLLSIRRKLMQENALRQTNEIIKPTDQ